MGQTPSRMAHQTRSETERGCGQAQREPAHLPGLGGGKIRTSPPGKSRTRKTDGRNQRLKAIPLHKRSVRNLTISKNGCWEWSGWRDRDGYGRMTIMRGKNQWRSEIVPRVVFKIFKGPIPNGNLVCHHCDNPACFRPSHLFSGTNLDNMRDKISKGRMVVPIGEECVKAKLTEEKVLEIRQKHSTGNFTQRELAVQYGVGFKAICKIVNFQRWKHV